MIKHSPSLASLKSHIRIHTELRNLIAARNVIKHSPNLATWRVTLGSILRRNLIAARECDQTFSQSGSLKSHIRIWYWEWNLDRCKECDHTFSQSGSHLKDTHLDPYWRENLLLPEKGRLLRNVIKHSTGLTAYKRHIGIHTGMKPLLWYIRNVIKHSLCLAAWRVTLGSILRMKPLSLQGMW